MSNKGIGRREFLNSFAAILASIPAANLSAVLTDDTTYVNRRLGIGFRIPQTWRFVSVEEMGTIEDNVHGLNPELQTSYESLLDSLELPFVAIQSPSSECISKKTVQIYLASHPSEVDPVDMLIDVVHKQMYGDRPRRLKKQFPMAIEKLRQDWQGCRSMLNTFRVSSFPKEITVSNCPAAEYTASVLFKNPLTDSFEEVRVRTIAIVHHEFTFLIRMTDAMTSPFDFDNFVSQIKLA